MIFTPKLDAIGAEKKGSEPHALARYHVKKSEHDLNIFEEIAVGQSIGAWDTRFVSVDRLQSRVAKVISVAEVNDAYEATIAFPLSLWNGDLSWLLTIVFGKMSFYHGVSLVGLNFEQGCFSASGLTGPQIDIETLRRRVGLDKKTPLLMGILKPNVAMAPEALANLYADAGQAGVHLVKDDEIRHDANFELTLRRIELVAQRKAKDNLKTLYVVHAPIIADTLAQPEQWCQRLESAGADALLVNVWTAGLGTLQRLRRATKLPLVAHPALAGAMGQGAQSDAIDPSVLLGTLMRAAGADLSLFPSPYGKIGLPIAITQAIATECQSPWPDDVKPTIPVPSAGIKPEHVEAACRDFGTNFILNAGTAIFASGESVTQSAKRFLDAMENCLREN